MTVYADLLRYRELFANLFRRDFQAKYKGSLLGIFWSLLNPLVLLGVYLVVFGLLFPNDEDRRTTRSTCSPGSPAGSSSRSRCSPAARSMIDSAELIKKVRFPRQLVAFSMVATQAVTFAVMIAILIVLSLVFVPDGAVDRLAGDPARASSFVGARRRAVAARRLPERALPRRRAHPHRGAAAVVLPHADPLELATLPGERAAPPARCSRCCAGATRSRRRSTPIRDALWSGHCPALADVVYLVVAAAVALALGAFVFRRVDDRIAVEL